MSNEQQRNAIRAIARAKDTMPFPADRLIARAIIADISDRGGWKHELRKTPQDVIEGQIIPTWEAIVRQVLRDAPTPAAEPEEETE